MSVIPLKHRHLFWSVNPDQVDLAEHKSYIIHQVLQYGDVSDYKWLLTVYPKSMVQEEFVVHPRQTYLPQTFCFIRDFLLNLTGKIDAKKYIALA